MREEPITPTPTSGAAACTLSLDAEEQKVLADLLRTAIEDTRFEAARTDTLDYRKLVQRREQVLRRIGEHLRVASGGVATPAGVH